MSDVTTKTLINRKHKSNVEYCVSRAHGSLPGINGDIVWAETRPNGRDDGNPDIEGIKMHIDVVNNSVSFQQKFYKELVGFVHRQDGQKVLEASFEPGGRCFIRGRSSGEQASGEDTDRNAILEIDPETGDWIGDPVPVGGGSFIESMEIDQRGNIYHADYVKLRKRDLDLNLLKTWSDSEFDFSNDFVWGVNNQGEVVTLTNEGGVYGFIYWDKEGNLIYRKDNSEYSSAGQSIGCRISRDYIVVVDNQAGIFGFDKNSGNLLWSHVGDLSGINIYGAIRDFAFTHNQNLLIGMDISSNDRKIVLVDPSNGDVIWDSYFHQGSGVQNYSIGQIGCLTQTFGYAFATVVGHLRIFRLDTGELLDGSYGFGRGRIGIHPFNNYRIQNYTL